MASAERSLRSTRGASALAMAATRFTCSSPDAPAAASSRNTAWVSLSGRRSPARSSSMENCRRVICVGSSGSPASPRVARLNSDRATDCWLLARPLVLSSPLSRASGFVADCGMLVAGFGLLGRGGLDALSCVLCFAR